MRLFLAIDLPLQVKKKLESQIASLKKDYADFNWVTSDNFHITIHFFGEVNNIDKIRQVVADSIYDIESFVLYSLHADLFLNHKIVLYVGFKREKTLEILASKIINGFHLNNDEKFVPHLTLARTRIPSKQQYIHLKKKMKHLPINISFPVKSVYLFQSIINKQPIYKKIARFPLLMQNQF